VALLTLVTLPVVIGTSVLVYYYLRYSVMIDRRLHGERWLVPARLYARPLTLRTGMAFTGDALVNVLNGLKYEQRPDVAKAPGEFVARQGMITFYPRPVKGGPTEPVAVLLERPKPPAKGAKNPPLEPERIKEIRGLETKRAYPTLTLEPELITYLFDEATREKRRVVKYGELPPHMVQAVLAIEDRRFFSHPGLDPFRILGAAVRNIQAESYIQGGSTITQQLVKNFFLTPERTMRRKLQEALLAFVLERRADKKDILELYLNEVYLGQVGSFSIHGVGQAARMYFHKDVANLTMSEGALLAGMIQSPNPYNPYRHPQRAVERRNLVLHSMREAGFIDEAVLKRQLGQGLGVVRPSVDSAEAPYFVDLVKAQLAERYAARDLATQNLSIYTSLDLSLQALGQQVLSDGLARVDKMLRRRKTRAPVQGALIAIEPKTGAVLAMVGGRSYGDSQYNRATLARRQPGSTFKPFVYLTAFEAVFDDPNLPPITPATVVEDAPTVFLFEDKEYTPQNYEDEYHGYVTLRQAMAHSLNSATVKVAEMVGYDKVANLWNNKMGMPAKVQPYPAVALGSFEATPLELATGYNMLANMGLKVPPVTVMSVADDENKTLEQHAGKPARAVRPESAFLVVHMMRSVMLNGTAAGAWAMGLPRGIDVAGKTGTTNDMRDAWFVGFTPELLVVVWVGFDDNSPVYLSGARAALPIWVAFMKDALAGTTSTRFQVPASNIIFVDIDPTTGLRSTLTCPKVFSEAFVAGTEPQEYCSWHGGTDATPPGWEPYRPSPEPSPRP
jgi:penicillin-binding protein 1B